MNILHLQLVISDYLLDWSVLSEPKFIVDMQILTKADFVSASIFISMNAILGKVNAV